MTFIMVVTLKLFADLRKYLPNRGEPLEVEVAQGVVVADLLDRYHVSREHRLICFVNGRHAGTDQRLRDGDVLSVFPPVAGG